VTLPPASLLLDTLRLTGERAPDLADAWRNATAARSGGALGAWAAWERVDLWLHHRLSAWGVLPSLAPAPRGALHHAARAAAQAHLAVDGETELVIGFLTRAGFPSVLLKGPARRILLPPPWTDVCRTSDVDVLLRVEDAETAWHALRAAGYQPWYREGGRPDRGETDVWGPSPVHLRPLARPGGAAVELHVTTVAGLAPAAAWSRLTRDARAVAWRGLDVLVPSATEMAWHALTHADLVEPGAWRLGLLLAGATALLAGPIAWDTIAARLETAEVPDRERAAQWLQAAAGLAGLATFPLAVARGPLALRRLVEWRLAVFDRPWLGRAARDKLLEAAARTEADLGAAPAVAARALPVRLRRRAAGAAAGVVYRAWCAAAR
jgi:hypothetical protein